MTGSAPIRLGMVGGGEGAFIGALHRAAARLDAEADFVCGALRSEADAARRSGIALGLPAERSYGDWREMLAREAALPDDARMQAVVIVTPNDLHLPIASAALAAGFHVLSDKPATRVLSEARELARAVAASGRCYALTHTYLGYPLLREARARVRGGELGAIRRVVVNYPQGWLATPIERDGQKQASWRADPARSGPGGCIADIGVHAFNLAEYVVDSPVVRICADLASVVPGRRVDDDAAAFLRFANGARGVLLASQVATGEDNDLSIDVYGDRGSLSWSHATPDRLSLRDAAAGDVRVLRAGTNVTALAPETRALCRTPAGHPEGFIAALANLYRDFAADVRAYDMGTPASRTARSPAGIEAAVRGMAFIEAAIASSATGQQWVGLEAGP